MLLRRLKATQRPERSDCGPGTLCRYEGAALMSDARLTGCYVVTPTGGTTEGSWGRLTAQARTCDGWGLPIPDDPITWLGEWFGTGKPPTRSESDVGAPYPY